MPISPEKKKLYPADWDLRSRFIRFYRARNRCEWCGALNHQPHPVTGAKVVLTVAHVYDEDPANASILNLAALCQRCHNRLDAPRRAARRKQKRERPALPTDRERPALPTERGRPGRETLRNGPRPSRPRHFAGWKPALPSAPSQRSAGVPPAPSRVMTRHDRQR